MTDGIKEKGQSIIEVIASIGIFLIAVSVILGLTVSNMTGQKTNEFQVIANNLAKEGVEVVRNIRDSNWLSGNNWDEGISDMILNENNEAIAIFNNGFLSLSLPVDDSLYLSELGIYNHNQEGKLSPFSRRLTLDNICFNIANKQEYIKEQPCSMAGEIKIGIKIISQVRWSEKGREKILVLESLIYDWK